MEDLKRNVRKYKLCHKLVDKKVSSFTMSIVSKVFFCIYSKLLKLQLFCHTTSIELFFMMLSSFDKHL